MDGQHEPTWRVGELARLTGLSVRTLHHYDQIGLLQPARRTPGGHRLYTPVDVTRLAFIVVLRRAGVTLAEIGNQLEAEPNGFDLATTMEQRSRALEGALIDTVAFGRLLADEPVDSVGGDPSRLRRLVRWVPQHSITTQPLILLVYADVELAYRRLIDMFGFEPGPISRRPDGTSGYAELSGPTGNIRLHAPRPGLSPPDPTSDPSAMTVVGVADITEHHDRAERAGAVIVRPVSALFGMREYQAFDHEHHLWCFQEPATRGT